MQMGNSRFADYDDPLVVAKLAELNQDIVNAEKLADRAWGDYPYGNKGGASNPSLVPLPSWWEGIVFADNHYSIEQAIEYLKVSEKILEARNALMRYRCYTLGETNNCQNLKHSGVLSSIRRNITWLEAQVIGLCEGNNTPYDFKLCPKSQEIIIENDTSVDIPEPASPSSSSVIETTEKTVSYLPIIVAGIVALVIVILLLRRKKNG